MRAGDAAQEVHTLSIEVIEGKLIREGSKAARNVLHQNGRRIIAIYPVGFDPDEQVRSSQSVGPFAKRTARKESLSRIQILRAHGNNIQIPVEPAVLKAIVENHYFRAVASCRPRLFHPIGANPHDDIFRPGSSRKCFVSGLPGCHHWPVTIGNQTAAPFHGSEIAPRQYRRLFAAISKIAGQVRGERCFTRTAHPQVPHGDHRDVLDPAHGQNSPVISKRTTLDRNLKQGGQPSVKSSIARVGHRVVYGVHPEKVEKITLSAVPSFIIHTAANPPEPSDISRP